MSSVSESLPSDIQSFRPRGTRHFPPRGTPNFCRWCGKYGHEYANCTVRPQVRRMKRRLTFEEELMKMCWVTLRKLAEQYGIPTKAISPEEGGEMRCKTKKQFVDDLKGILPADYFIQLKIARKQARRCK